VVRRARFDADELGVLLTLVGEPALSLIEVPQDPVSRVLDPARRVHHVVEQVPSKSVDASATVS
jgi:hypothetical protein